LTSPHIVIITAHLGTVAHRPGVAAPQRKRQPDAAIALAGRRPIT
jgi:hypothetical protein